MNNWSVTVLTPNGRRHVQKCTPNTTLLQILEQTCQKHDFKPEEYDLTHHNKVVDSTIALRFSGLPNNAFLEMAPAKQIRVESEVTLGLQLENGNRLMGTYKPSTTLQNILEALVPEQSNPESNPVVIYMRKEVYGEDLRETTLKSLGLTSGRAIIRLIHRTPEQLKTQANVSAPLPQKNKEDRITDDFEMSHENTKFKVPVRTGETTSKTNEQHSFSNIENKVDRPDDSVNIKQDELPKEVTEMISKSEEKDTIVQKPSIKMDISPEDVAVKEFQETEEIELDKNIIIIGERNAVVFSQETSNNIPFGDLPDDFFDLSVEEVKKLYVELGKKRQELENTPLKTEALRNVETTSKLNTKLNKNPNVVLRIIFPDRLVLQANFVPLDKIETVRDFIKSYLESPDMPFDLYVTPPKQILSPNLSLVDAKCVPSAILHFGPQDVDLNSISSCQYLHDAILSQVSSPMAAQLSALKTRGVNTSNRTKHVLKSSQVSSSNTANKTLQNRETPSTSSSSQKENDNLPKWFKMKK